MALNLVPAPKPTRSRTQYTSEAKEIADFFSENEITDPQMVNTAYATRARAEGLVRSIRTFGGVGTAINRVSDTEFYVHVWSDPSLAPVFPKPAKPKDPNAPKRAPKTEK